MSNAQSSTDDAVQPSTDTSEVVNSTTQMKTPPSLASRLRGALYAHATLDALGAPLEFQWRGSFPLLTTMQPNSNFNLPAGCFTDDTSMALCLAHSLLSTDAYYVEDQARRYIRWWREGYCSSVGRCFDIGMGTAGTLRAWEGALEEGRSSEEVLEVIGKRWGGERFCGNGSLMRVLPVALLGFEGEAVEMERVAEATSRVTHPHVRCLLCCRLFVRLVGMALEGKRKEEMAAAVGDFVWEVKNSDDAFVKRFVEYGGLADWSNKSEDEISSSGYVLDSLEAALWAFFTTDTLREGAIKVVNLGDDADTVGAIHGGLAGVFYGEEAIPAEWLSEMKGFEMVREVADKIVERVGT
ncbi:ADP-ribosyl-[dinitrogen ] glycohydrolase [Cyphellophora attinorum]|uniref:ADP-ribosylhydrolase ARH3 n=1 Tax=Cyphellophora attinorum TaxID=1664694 RepID=A0A0N0NPU6_9EURO|nr:ADP-ribosyl-[dinitrogen ] glycohydrolase [Phialophora attinorum]KPI43138.1 ADP-ribosyl-[dinitrogen ] glycohydrolase [Phialophora attinorum]